MIYDFSANELILACSKLGVDFSEGDFGYGKAIKDLGKGLLLSAGLASTVGGVGYLGYKGYNNYIKPPIERRININKAQKGLNEANNEITNITAEVNSLEDGGWKDFKGVSTEAIEQIEANGITDKAQAALSKAKADKERYETQLKNLGAKSKSNSGYKPNYPTSSGKGEKTLRYS